MRADIKPLCEWDAEGDQRDGKLFGLWWNVCFNILLWKSLLLLL